LNNLIAQNKDDGESYASVANAYYNTLSDYFFGNRFFTYLDSTANPSYENKLYEFWGKYCNHEISNMEIGITTETNFENGIIGGHSYTLADLNDNYISLINVWDTADRLNLDIGTFLNMDTAIFVYGYGETDDPVANSTGNPVWVSVNEIMQDVASWKDNNSNTDIQTFAEQNISKTDYLAINSIIQDDLTASIFA
jgi:hypothetical protein